MDVWEAEERGNSVAKGLPERSQMVGTGLDYTEMRGIGRKAC